MMCDPVCVFYGASPPGHTLCCGPQFSAGLQQTITEAQFLGLKVKMLTGDAIAIAKETCKLLSLGTRVYNSDTLIRGGGINGITQHDLVEMADGFAEVFPEHKYLLMQATQG
jgi:H+-transporting ATPase